MKEATTKCRVLLLSCALLLISSGTLFAQTYYKSVATGLWSAAATWNTSTDSVTWVAATQAPTGSESILISSGNTVTIDSAGTYPLTITGYVKNSGALLHNTGETSATFVIANGGWYEHNITGGTLPAATWQTGSTVYITGTTTSTSIASGGTQNFYNYRWNCPNQTSSFGASFATTTNPGITIGGDVTILSTGVGRFQYFTSNPGHARIMGNLTVSGSSNVTITGTSSVTKDTLDVYGNVNVNTTGDFSISRGSQGGPNSYLSAALYWFYGPNVSIVAGNLQNSDTLGVTRWVFKRSGTQNVGITATTIASRKALRIEVDPGTTIQLTAPLNVTDTLLLGGMIISTASNPLIMGWLNVTSMYSAVLSNLTGFGGGSTNFVNGPMAYLSYSAGSKTMAYAIGKGTAYRPATLSLTQSTASTLSRFTAEMFNSSARTFGYTLPSAFTKVSAVRYYNIAEAAGGSAFTDGIVKLSYDSDDAVTNASALKVVKDDNAGHWVSLAGTGTANTTGTITTTNGFSDLTGIVFTLADSADDNPLPVQVTSFAASVSRQSVTLNWRTGSELNNAGFNVLRRNAGESDFKLISSYLSNSALKGLGTSAEGREYSYVDNSVHESGSYVYRLQLVFTNGSTEDYNEVKVTVRVPKDFALFQNFPNPFNPITTITYDVPSTSTVTIVVYDMLGSKVATLVNETKAPGEYAVTFDGTKLASGVYFYQMTAGNFSSVKKLMLTK